MQKKTNSPTLIITGGTPLYGVVRAGGAKNASYKLMIAALLGQEESRLINLPGISDVVLVGKIIEELGGEVRTVGDHTLFVNPRNVNSYKVKQEHGEVSRASSLFMAPLLARFGKAEVPLPGGDKIGKRPLGRHIEGLEKMGARFFMENDMLKAETDGLKGTHYKFEKNTHTGTETLIIAAVLAEGKTVLENAALEPEIDDLIKLLNNMGAKIRRRSFKVIEIEGVKSLKGTIHRVMPDRNEIVSYACAAIASKGDIVVENARQEYLVAFLDKLEEAGAGYEVGEYGIRFFYKRELRATDVEVAIHPGFMTDWQPLWATLICHAHGVSVIHETVSQNRFQYVDTLREMGAKIETFDQQVSDPEKIYNFDWKDKKSTDIHAIKIFGPTQFTGGEFTVHDLRAGATTLLAAISGNGTTILKNIEQIDRGYEKIDEKLKLMGANIVRSN